jgi:hypothetical protein
VVAIDIAPNFSRWPEVSRQSGIIFCGMDACALGFAADAFPLVLERASLHHIADWSRAIVEMVRVSSDRVFLEEPVDDPRSDAKRRTYDAQDLFLRLQSEVGYPHYRHLDRHALHAAVERQGVILEEHLEKSDTPVTFDEFFESFPMFAARSGRQEYWLEALQALRSRFGGAPLCDDDTLTILAKTRQA